MKKISYFIFALFALPSVLQSQITIQSEDISPIGYIGVQSRDSFPAASIQPGGTGMQTWDFSALKDMDRDTLSAKLPAETPYGDQYPNADISVARDTSIYLYFNKDDNALSLLGISGVLNYQGFLVEGNLTFTPSQSLLRFPASYNDDYTEVLQSKVQVPGSAIGSTFDSLRLITFTTRHVKIDAFGELITPTTSYQTLRSTEIEVASDSVYIYSGGIWFGLQGSEKDTIIFSNWWTNTDGLGFPVVQIESKTNGQIRMVSWLKDAISSTGEKNPLIRLAVFPNPASEVLHVGLPEFHEGKLEVYDVNGRLCISQKTQGGQAQVNLGALTTGPHVVVLKDQQGRLTGFERFSVVK